MEHGGSKTSSKLCLTLNLSWKWLVFIAVVLVFLQGDLYPFRAQTIFNFQIPMNTSFSHEQLPYKQSGNILKQHRQILLWTSWFRLKYWFFDGKGNGSFISHNCQEQRCDVTTNHSDLQTSDLVLFHVRNLHRGKAGMPQSHPPNQRWVFAMRESPVHTYGLPPLNHMFNLTMTYSQRSDIYFGYGRTVKLSQQSHIPTKNYARSKSKLVLWYVSNCGASLRRNLVKALSSYLQVDIFGRCGKPDPCKIKHKIDSECTRKMMLQYKFYLALENTLCREYATEKLWRALQNEMIPVVLGADLEDYLKVAPPNSFIHVENFTSVKNLADYLLYLNENEVAYNAYFKWREKFTVHERIDIQNQLVCQLCEIAHQEVHQRKSYKISEWWSRRQFCRGRIQYHNNSTEIVKSNQTIH